MTSQSKYTLGHSEAVLRAHASRTAEKSARFLLEHLRPDAHVLDVGCGPGSITVSLAGYVPQGSIIGVDESAEVVAKAQRQAEQMAGAGHGGKRSGQCRFEVASVYELPYADDHFDVVYCHQVLLHLTEPVRALKEMSRVCKPGGLVAARESDLSSTMLYPSNAALERWQAVSEHLIRSTGAEPNAGRRLITWALAAGYTPDTITYSASPQTYAGQPTAAWYGPTWADRVRGAEWSTKAIHSGNLTQPDIDEIASAWEEWGRQPDAVFSSPCGEILLRK